MQILLEYLRRKIQLSKRHIACNHLKIQRVSDQELEAYLQYAYDKIAEQLNRRTSRGHALQAGEAGLTQVSALIGEYVLNETDGSRSPQEWFNVWFRRRLMMGNLFVECFYQHEWINIGKVYDEDFIPYSKLNYNQKKSSAPYIIKADAWPQPDDESKDPLHGISLEVPEDIKGIMQYHTQSNKSLIKGRTVEDNEWFKPYLESGFVKSINILQQTPWIINTEVHNVLIANRDKLLNQYTSFEEKYKSKVIEFDRTLEKARNLLNKEFYYYMECDYRGRIYYTTSFLNLQSNDIARGQLLFAEGKEMTDEGRAWLAIHTACSYNETYKIKELPEWLTTDYKPYLEQEGLFDISVDKMTLQDRALWTVNNHDKILKYWVDKDIRLEAEKPIAFLACCQEWYNMEGVEDYISYMPIPIDGSNNGWQHLSAISKDKKAGKLVGVVPSIIQKDFYVQTAKELMKLMPEWFAERRMPMKAIRKGIAKRGSMTRAYSAGASKIAENMYLDCHVEDYTNKYNITKEDCLLLARNLVKAIDVVCAGPLQTMKHLQNIAGQEISSDMAKEKGRKSIDWVTPSGFPVVYSSWVMTEVGEKASIANDLRSDWDPENIDKRTAAPYKSIRIDFAGKEATDKPKIQSFMSGISPNFIHSMDASHMSLVINEWGGAFGPVHDSFSVHACDVNDLLDITKSKFVEMYDKENFFDDMEKMILTEPEDFNLDQPGLGELIINEVEDSDYFFA